MRLGPLTLTRTEWAILEHRLQVPGAVAEVFNPWIGDVADGYDPDDIRAVCELLLAGEWRRANDVSEAMVRDILVDCVEGSTWITGEESRQESAAHIRAGVSLAEKIREHYRLDRVRFPV